MGRSRRRAGGGVSGEVAAVEAAAMLRERRGGGVDFAKKRKRGGTYYLMFSRHTRDRPRALSRHSFPSLKSLSSHIRMHHDALMHSRASGCEGTNG